MNAKTHLKAGPMPGGDQTYDLPTSGSGSDSGSGDGDG